LNIFCIILARGGSKGLPGKNIKTFIDKPLIAHTIEAAKEAGLKVHVSSDCSEILNISESFGAVPLKRPEELSTDTATSDSAIHFHLEESSKSQKYDSVMLLQPTSPLRNSEDIKKAMELYQIKGPSVFSVTELKVSPFRSYTIEENMLSPILTQTEVTRRQDYQRAYAANGAIYIFDSDSFLREKTIPKDKVVPYIMSQDKSIDIDTIVDFKLAEFIYNNQLG